MSNALAIINRRVKALKKKHPLMKHQVAQKKASAEYRAGKIHGTRSVAKKKSVSHHKHKKSASRVHKKIMGKRPSRSGSAIGKSTTKPGIGSVSQKAREQKKILETMLGELLARQYLATTKKEKTRIGKKVNIIKKKLASVKRML